MARIATTDAYSLRVRAHELRAAGLSLRAIAKEMGKPLASIQNFLASPPPDVDPKLGIDAAIELKSTVAKHRGPMQIRAMVRGADLPVPSETTLARIFSLKNLAQKGTIRSKKHQPYWCEFRVSRVLQQIQIDTVKIRTPKDGILTELLTARDVWSGATLLQIHNGTEQGMLLLIARIFAVLGVPETIQSDNGTTDFSLPARHRLRPWHKLAFSYGVKRVQFIPEAEPFRNGSVESFHDWLQLEWLHHGRFNCPTQAELPGWIADRLHFYNCIKPLGALGGKSSRQTPADVLPSLDLSAASSFPDLSYDPNATGVISFIRPVLNCLAAVVKAPGTIFKMSPELEGHYCRFDLDTSNGQGLVWSRRPVDLSEVIASGQRKINGRFVDSANLTINPGVVVATFEHELGGDQSEGIYYPDFSDLSGYVPCPVDDDELLRQWKKTLKQKIPSLLPSRYELVNLGNGEWYVTDQESGDLVWTHQASPEVIQHAREITG